MVNVSESMFKDREVEQVKAIVTPEPKWYWESESYLCVGFRGQQYSSVNNRHLTQQQYSQLGTWKPCIFPDHSGRQTVRNAYKGAGLGCWKKRMPPCNEVDTSVYRLMRKHAHVQLVSDGKIICRITLMEESK